MEKDYQAIDIMHAAAKAMGAVVAYYNELSTVPAPVNFVRAAAIPRILARLGAPPRTPAQRINRLIIHLHRPDWY